MYCGQHKTELNLEFNSASSEEQARSELTLPLKIRTVQLFVRESRAVLKYILIVFEYKSV